MILNKTKKKILFISAYYYPQNTIATIRVGQWVKYLSRLGYDITVVTTKKYFFNEPLDLKEILDNVEVIEVDYIPKSVINVVSKFFQKEKALYENKVEKKLILREYMRMIRSLSGSLIDIYSLWVKPAYEIADQILNQDRYIALISSYNPPASHIIASKLKRKYPYIKWIADFRDLWAYNHIYSAKSILGIYEKHKEKRTLTYADYIVTVSEPLTNLMKKVYPEKKIITIENGFDPDEFPNWENNIIRKPKIDESIRIVYTGSIYIGKQDIISLIQACNDLLDTGMIKFGQITLDIYGQSSLELSKILNKNRLNRYGFVKLKGLVSRPEALKVQKEADLLLFLDWNDPSAHGVLTGKLFEYIVSGTPIISIGTLSRTSASTLIEKTRTGICLFRKDEIKSVLMDIIKSKSIDFYDPDIEEIKKYSRIRQIKKLVRYTGI